jgi:ketosteroid isomerase-like protein/mannose-6-phosphate isomerase-like protein (cupin superfamily)
MRRFAWVLAGLVAVALAAGCTPAANVEQEKAALMSADREWSGTVKDPAKFATFFADGGAMHPQGMPTVTGRANIEKMFAEMANAPGSSLQWTPTKAEVGGDVGYTVGTYQSSMNGVAEKGKYVTAWKKQADGSWKVMDDIFNADEMPKMPAGTHTTLAAPADLKWGDAPPAFPAGLKLAVVAGDPGKAEPYVLRLQAPANYRVAPHFHPVTENVTVLSGTAALGMGDTFDEKKMETVGPGGYTTVPAEMHHYFLAKSAVTLQIHGIGPFAITYVNAADDPRNKKTD